MEARDDRGRIELCDDEAGGKVLVLAGDWVTGKPCPEAREYLTRTEAATRLRVEDGGLGAWDTTLLVFLTRLQRGRNQGDRELDLGGLPEGVRRLLQLAGPLPATRGKVHRQPGLVARVGSLALDRGRWTLRSLGFIGELAAAFGRLLTGRARLRLGDVGHFLQECGAEALPIVSLISFLVGLILAFIGSVQLELFGAQLFVANLVGIGMARDMGAMMTGVIMAGRTGASFAARLGTMQVNDEIDALRTLGISPMEFLVLPRVLALVLMLPLLCCYADLLGIVGGAVVCAGMFDISIMQYIQQTREAVPLHHFAGGLVKATVYGLVVAVTGCHRGLACGRSAQAVGEATTAAVVTAIVWIVVWCAILTVVYTVLGV